MAAWWPVGLFLLVLLHSASGQTKNLRLLLERRLRAPEPYQALSQTFSHFGFLQNYISTECGSSSLFKCICVALHQRPKIPLRGHCLPPSQSRFLENDIDETETIDVIDSLMELYDHVGDNDWNTFMQKTLSVKHQTEFANNLYWLMPSHQLLMPGANHTRAGDRMVHPADSKAWADLVRAIDDATHPEDLRADAMYTDPCAYARCELDAAEEFRRITVIIFTFHNVRRTKDTVVVPHSVGQMTHLRVLYLYLAPFSFALPPNINQLQHLHTLFISLQTPTSLSALAKAVHGLSSLLFLCMSNTYEGDVPLQLDATPAFFNSICSLKNLRALRMSAPMFHTYQAPQCIGESLHSLEYLHMVGTHLPGFLPDNFGNLRQLKVFVAFENGMQFTKKYSDCEFSYKARARWLTEDTFPFVCPSSAISGHIPNSFKKLSNMQKFWVDANAFNGSIPDWIGTHWRKLRALDLYNNRFTGTIPRSLATLPLLETLQLQDNRLSGPLDPAFFKMPRLQTLLVDSNPGLHGNIVTDALPHEFAACHTRVRIFAGKELRAFCSWQSILLRVCLANESKRPIHHRHLC